MKFASPRLARLDLNLLVVLRELLRERNVSRAAARVGVSQPAASAALARLRRYFDDDLLVRRGGAYELSVFAFQLREQVESVCADIDRLLASREDADPATSRRRYVVVMSDYTIAVMGQALAGRMNSTAPAARLDIALVREALAANIAHTIRAVDCVVCPPSSRFPIPEMRSASLFTDRWVCVVAAHNDRYGQQVADLNRLADADWVVPYHDDADFPSALIVSRQLARLGIRPRVAVRVDSFQAVPQLVASTGCVALVQERLAWASARHVPLRILDCPIPAEPIDIRLWWHRRLDDDPAHRWFRRLVHRAARSAVSAPHDATSAHHQAS